MTWEDFDAPGTNGGPPETSDAGADEDDALYERIMREEHAADTTDAEFVEQLERVARDEIAIEDREFRDDIRFRRLRQPTLSLLEQHPFSVMERVDQPLFAKLRVQKAENEVDAVPTCFPGLNRVCMMQGGQVGLAHGWHVVLAAASNTGKSSCALNMIRSFMEHGEDVLYFALEEDIEDVAARMMAGVHRRPLKHITRGRYFDIDQDREAARLVCDLPGKMWVNRQPLVRLDDLARVIVAFHDHFDVRTFVLDYLQLAKTEGAKSESELYGRVTEISEQVRQTAREHRLLSICLSQLNRRASSEHNRCPTIYDLLGGSSIENDSDMTILIDHCKKHYKYRSMEGWTDTDLIVGKNRKGPRKRIPIRLDWGQTRVYEIDREGEEMASYGSAGAFSSVDQTDVFARRSGDE